MQRPIGVILLAGAAGLAALYQIYNILIYLGIVDFTFVGRDVSFPEAQWGAALWSLLIAAIWGLSVLAGRIYKVGILMQGKRPNLPEIWRWLRTE